ncbi:MAG TPA: alpha-glucan family phosphorylase, partial [Chromatiales bacterium]|nr:alpha-glucan family phosphorylase [Chromatiales bacterium]
AITQSRAVNAVSRIHARVSAEICADAWPEIPPHESPVGYVTNGVHVPTFIQPEWVGLLEEHLGPSWIYQLTDRALMDTIMDIPQARFWSVNQRIKSDMFSALRVRLERQHARNQSSEAHVQRLVKYLDPDKPDVLTIGFGRRFATYKRATLLFTDLDLLRQIVDHDERPVVFVFAGKAHPADEPGQQMLREIHRVANLPEFIGKIVLVEGYDLGLGRLLTAGVDVWLNTPVYPMEASGTSGMKAAMNGTVNLSVLDGWWAEAYDGSNGWAIPPSVGIADEQERDRGDAETLYEILQDHVIPLYYQRPEKLEYSPEWVEMCKRSMATILPDFNSNRVLHDYACRFYGPAAAHGKRIAEQDWRGGRELADWTARVRSAWPGVTMRLVEPAAQRIGFESELSMEVEVDLNGLSPEDIRVECVVHRKLCSEVAVPVRQFSRAAPPSDGIRYVDDKAVLVAPFEPVAGSDADGRCRYRLRAQLPWCGRLSYEIRAVPQHRYLSHPYQLGLMHWL